MDQNEIRQVNTSNEDYMVIDPVEQELETHCTVLDMFAEDSDGVWLNATGILKSIGFKSPNKGEVNLASKWLHRHKARYKKEHKRFFVKVSTPMFVVENQSNSGNHISAFGGSRVKGIFE